MLFEFLYCVRLILTRLPSPVTVLRKFSYRNSLSLLSIVFRKQRNACMGALEQRWPHGSLWSWKKRVNQCRCVPHATESTHWIVGKDSPICHSTDAVNFVYSAGKLESTIVVETSRRHLPCHFIESLTHVGYRTKPMRVFEQITSCQLIINQTRQETRFNVPFYSKECLGLCIYVPRRMQQVGDAIETGARNVWNASKGHLLTHQRVW